jgi:hypothetical protein
MNIVKTITDSRSPALVAKVQGIFKEYQRLRERHDTLAGLPLELEGLERLKREQEQERKREQEEFEKTVWRRSWRELEERLEREWQERREQHEREWRERRERLSAIASLEIKLRKFCAAIPVMQKEAEGSAEASAYLYAGLVETLPVGKQAVALITKEITWLEKKRADAEAEKLLLQKEAEEKEEKERRRQEAEDEYDRRHAAREIMGRWFIVKKVLVIMLTVAYLVIGFCLRYSLFPTFDQNKTVELLKYLFLGYLVLTWVICVFPYPDIRMVFYAGIVLAIIFLLGDLYDFMSHRDGGVHFLLPIVVAYASFKLLSGREQEWGFDWTVKELWERVLRRLRW